MAKIKCSVASKIMQSSLFLAFKIMRNSVFLLALFFCISAQAGKPDYEAAADFVSQEIKEFSAKAAIEEYHFSACLVGNAGRYYKAKEEDESIADLVVASCIKHINQRREYLLRLYATCDDCNDMGTQAKADSETRKMLADGKKTALDSIIKFRLKLMPNKPAKNG